MRGLELAEAYYQTYGKEMIAGKFPSLVGRVAAGLVGQGSECFGFDDEISKDHDYGPSFCLWLTADDYAKYGEALQREYEALPAEFAGTGKRQTTEYGKGRVGVLSIPEFYYCLIGMDRAPKSNKEWMKLSENALSTAVNGKVFADPLGEFSSMRNHLLQFYPEDVRLKKIAARAAAMAQSGQYNYARAMKRGENVAAAMAISEFIKNTISMVYLINKKYMPFYKWMHRGMKELAVLSEIGDILNLLVQTPEQSSAWENCKAEDYLYTLNTADQRVIIIEAVCNIILQELTAQAITENAEDNFLQNHTHSIMSKIQDPYIRSLQVLEG